MTACAVNSLNIVCTSGGPTFLFRSPGHKPHRYTYVGLFLLKLWLPGCPGDTHSGPTNIHLWHNKRGPPYLKSCSRELRLVRSAIAKLWLHNKYAALQAPTYQDGKQRLSLNGPERFGEQTQTKAAAQPSGSCQTACDGRQLQKVDRELYGIASKHRAKLVCPQGCQSSAWRKSAYIALHKLNHANMFFLQVCETTSMQFA